MLVKQCMMADNHLEDWRLNKIQMYGYSYLVSPSVYSFLHLSIAFVYFFCCCWLEYHLVIVPKQDDPSKAVLAACSEKQLIKLAAKELLNSQSLVGKPGVYLKQLH